MRAATVVPAANKWKAVSATVRTSRKRKSPSSGNPNPKAKRRRKLGLDSSSLAPFWDHKVTDKWSKKLPSVAFNCVKKVTGQRFSTLVLCEEGRASIWSSQWRCSALANIEQRKKGSAGGCCDDYSNIQVVSEKINARKITTVHGRIEVRI